MKSLFFVLLSSLVPLALSCGTASAQKDSFEFAGDVIAAGETSGILTNVENDVFAVGNFVNINANVSGDSHAAGRSVSISGNVGGNVYAGGDTIVISGRVGRDVLAFGNHITVENGPVHGNVRLMGTQVTLISPVSGSVLIGASNASINAPIDGDVEFYGGTLTFGENARIAGTLVMTGAQENEVPQSVISPDRVTFIQKSGDENSGRADFIVRHTFMSLWPNYLTGFGLIIIAFLFGTIWLATMPDRSTMAYLVSKEKPFKSLIVGILWLSMFFGLIIVLGMTLIGIPLILIAILLAFLAWVVGYVGGAYFLAARVIEAFGHRIEKLGHQVLALGIGLVVAYLLSLAPIFGWFTQLALVFFGLGAIALAFIYRKVAAPAYAQLHSRLKNE